MLRILECMLPDCTFLLRNRRRKNCNMLLAEFYFLAEKYLFDDKFDCATPVGGLEQQLGDLI